MATTQNDSADIIAENIDRPVNLSEDELSDEEDNPERRNRKPTEKMRILQNEEQQKREAKFIKTYEKWKEQVKKTRVSLKGELTEEEIDTLLRTIEDSESSVIQVFNDIRQHGTPSQTIKRKTDACAAVTLDIVSLMQHRYTETGDKWDEPNERARLHSLLDSEYAHSIYGSTIMNASIASHAETERSRYSNKTETSSIVAKRAEVAAELAAKEAELKAIEEEEVEKAKLEREIKRLQAQKEIKIGQAKMKVYETELEGSKTLKKADYTSPQTGPHTSPKTILSSHAENPIPHVAISRVVSNPTSPKICSLIQPENLVSRVPILCAVPKTPVDNTASFTQVMQTIPSNASEKPVGRAESPTQVKESVPSVSSKTPVDQTQLLAQAIQSSMLLGRLPLPEPMIFNGDPLQYAEWKDAFITLIDNKAITSQEKFYFLKKYAGKEAGKAIQGFFLSHTDESYKAAWKTLETRYGNPFILQRAFRDKLSNWPTIAPKDAEGLREFADFLQGCEKAMITIPSLNILNDCMENQRLMSKLPIWASARWNRMSTKTVQESSKYPDFQAFVKFVVDEANIACNPVSSQYALKTDKKPRESKSRYANSLAIHTNSSSSKNTSETNNPSINKKCPFCTEESHYLPSCPAFAQKTLKDRRKFILEQKRCYGCLRIGHTSKDCKNKHTCQTCKSKHPTCLHDPNFRKYSNDTQETTTPKVTADASASSLNTKLEGSTSTSTMVPVWISTDSNPNEEKLVYALLDTQSTTTFIDKEVSKSLHVKSEPVKLTLTTLTNRAENVACDKVSGLQIRGYTSDIKIKIPSAYTRDIIPIETSQIPTNETAKNWPHLKDLANKIPPLLDCEAGLLIGFNCPQALVPREVIYGKDDEPFAVRMDLGWSIVGNSCPAAHNFNVISFCHHTSVKESPLITPIDALKALERDFQDTDTSDKTMSQEDIKFLEIMDAGIRKTENGHYEMPLPFKSQTVPPSLPDNHSMAVSRLNYLKRKFERNQNYHSEYLLFMNDIITQGYAERITEREEGDHWYIPHHGVYHSKKQKLRVVFDCSAKFKGQCLNDNLLVGPDLTNNLNGVLIRFRQHPIAVICDIEKMFYQFYIRQEHRNFLCFLWWEDGDTSKDAVVYRMNVHLFGAASSPGCANYGFKYLAKQNEEDFPLASKFIKRNFYVDDGLTSEPTEERAMRVVDEARRLCVKGGLRLHKFSSNNRQVMESIPTSERTSNSQTLDLSFDDLPMERALGMKWSVESDTLHLSYNFPDQPLTRRSILSTVASLYDPLGLIAPCLLQGKKILQEMCHKGLGWDDPPDYKLSQRFETWKNDLKTLDGLSISRCYYPNDFVPVFSKTQLHHFSDASSIGYGSCSYLRFQSKEDDVYCSLVVAKARVAPTKITTIPRLELSAALVSAEMSAVLKQELDLTVDQEYFWTDSQIVLGYLNNEARKFHIFVANRVQKIRQLTKPEQWHYIPTIDNPADHASRSLSIKEIGTSRWFQGPKFLWDKNWKNPTDVKLELNPEDPEIKKVSSFNTVVKKTTFYLCDNLSHISNWYSALHVVAQTLRLSNGIKKRGKFSVDEIENAELALIKDIQQKYFRTELDILMLGKNIPKSSSIYQLDIFIHRGIMRVGGRLRKANMDFNSKHPMVLPRQGHTTRLIIDYCHKKANHQGKGLTVNEAASRGYFILRGSKEFENYIRKCVVCRKLRGLRLQQKMADLPSERVDPSPPFTFTGIDCFGPFLVKNGRRECKRYGLLFTCLCCRAIHIESLDDLSTDAFINGLRCFIALRGSVRMIYCDQGSNFIGANNELKQGLEELNSTRVNDFLLEKHCEFKFNAPGASHAGGVWERQIRSIRSIMGGILTKHPSRLDDSSLRTLFYEVMAIVNSRPLTATKNGDSTEILTPNHILTMKPKIPLPPPGKFVKEDVYLKKRWRRVQYLSEQFWSQWRREYVQIIARRQKWHNVKRNIMVGDIVLLVEPDTTRNEWPLGRVVEVKVDDDKLVRRVKVMVGTSSLDNNGRRKCKPSILERPIQKLVLILETQ